MGETETVGETWGGGEDEHGRRRERRTDRQTESPAGSVLSEESEGGLELTKPQDHNPSLKQESMLKQLSLPGAPEIVMNRILSISA